MNIISPINIKFTCIHYKVKLVILHFNSPHFHYNISISKNLFLLFENKDLLIDWSDKEYAQPRYQIYTNPNKTLKSNISSNQNPRFQIIPFSLFIYSQKFNFVFFRPCPYKVIKTVYNFNNDQQQLLYTLERNCSKCKQCVKSTDGSKIIGSGDIA